MVDENNEMETFAGPDVDPADDTVPGATLAVSIEATATRAEQPAVTGYAVEPAPYLDPTR